VNHQAPQSRDETDEQEFPCISHAMVTWWLSHSEKCEFVSWDDYSKYMVKNVPNHQPVTTFEPQEVPPSRPCSHAAVRSHQQTPLDKASSWASVGANFQAAKNGVSTCFQRPERGWVNLSDF